MSILVSSDPSVDPYDYSSTPLTQNPASDDTRPPFRGRRYIRKTNAVDADPQQESSQTSGDEGCCSGRCGTNARPVSFPTTPDGIEDFKMHTLHDILMVLHTIKWILTGILAIWLILLLLSVGVLYGGDEFLRKMNDSGVAELLTQFVQTYTTEWEPYVNTTLMGVADVAATSHAVITEVQPSGFIQSVLGIESIINRLNQTITGGSLQVSLG